MVSRDRLSLLAILCIVGCALLAGAAWLWTRSDEPPAPRPVIEPRDAGGRLIYPVGRFPVLQLGDSGRLAVRSVLKTRGPMGFGESVWDEAGAGQGPMLVRVDLSSQMLSVFRGGDEIGSTVILYGADSKPTPVGVFPILQKVEDYHSRTYDAPMPYMLRLTNDGVAIHGSHVKERFATHGCIGVPLDFARKLFANLSIGDRVVIVGTERT